MQNRLLSRRRHFTRRFVGVNVRYCPRGAADAREMEPQQEPRLATARTSPEAS